MRYLRKFVDSSTYRAYLANNDQWRPFIAYVVNQHNEVIQDGVDINISVNDWYSGTEPAVDQDVYRYMDLAPLYIPPVAITELIYNGSPQYLTTTGFASHGTIYYSMDETNWSTTRITGTAAGTYTSYWKLDGDSGYESVSSTPIATTIAKANRTVSFSNPTTSVDEGSTVTNVATVSAGASDGTLTYSSSNTNYATVNSSGVVTGVAAGSVTITASITSGADYNDASASYSLTVQSTFVSQDFSYTGTVQECTLPAGTYKLQCWGAQGGSNAAASSYGITAKTGGKGGYSEGIVTLSSQTTVYIFVGGQGSSSGNGGFNCGGGCNSGQSTYSSTNYTSGKYFNTDGSQSSNSNWGVSNDYIPCSPGDSILWIYDSTESISVSSGHCIMCYNSSKSVVDYWQAGYGTYTRGDRVFTVPSNCYYLRPSFCLNKGAKLFVNNKLVWQPSNNVGRSRMGTGGGATDIALVDSTMTYSNYRNDRSAASLLSRIIVAGGGSGGAMASLRVEPVQETTYLWKKSMNADGNISRTITSGGFTMSKTSSASGTNVVIPFDVSRLPATVTFKYSYTGSSTVPVFDSPNQYLTTWGTDVTNANIRANVSGGSGTITVTMNNSARPFLGIYGNDMSNGDTLTVTNTEITYSSPITTETSYQVGYVGGGITGGGYSSTYQGQQNTAGSEGSFGLGANQTSTNYRYCSAAGGGGWYGGGGGQRSDSTITYCKYSGGGSGWVNTSANASYRPSGYTSLELDSGTTYAGSSSFPNTAGTGNETGHSGNGYAKITKL